MSGFGPPGTRFTLPDSKKVIIPPETMQKFEPGGTHYDTYGDGFAELQAKREYCFATLNCLGDAFNPFEFKSNLASFSTPYSALENIFKTRNVDQFVGYLKNKELIERSDTTFDRIIGTKPMWELFTTDVLKNDNKQLDNRYNLITFAMKTEDGVPHWQTHETTPESWLAKIKAFSYLDQNLYIWDCFCNYVASEGIGFYLEICISSYLNPDNFGKHADTFFEKLKEKAGDLPVIAGVQEYPNTGTPKALAFKSALEKYGLKFIPGAGGTGFVLSKNIVPISHTTPVFTTCMDVVIKNSEHTVDDKMQKGFTSTTANKTTVIMVQHVGIDKKFACIVVHSKEPKKGTDARVLSAYVEKIASEMFRNEPMQYVAMLDSNTATDAVSQAFTQGFSGGSTHIVPYFNIPTTCKERSFLHGQCYDDKKSGVCVKAPKDKIVVRGGKILKHDVFPQLYHDNKMPNPEWGSDHSLTTCTVSFNI